MEIPAEVPGWYSILESAEKWATPPWEITGDNARLLWHLRRTIVDRELARGRQERIKAKTEGNKR